MEEHLILILCVPMLIMSYLFETYREKISYVEPGLAHQIDEILNVFIRYISDLRKQNTSDLRHHNIILGPRYEDLFTDIFDRKILSEDFSQYLHIPTITDPSMAPEGYHAAYTLVPVPHLGGKIDWEETAPKLCNTVLDFWTSRDIYQI